MSVGAENGITHRRTRGGIFSPLMMRIMAVNVFALIALVGGILYLNDYRENLIAARVAELEVQARIIAGALGESATGGPDRDEIDLAPARQIISRLVGPTNHRARLFTADGRLLADSRFMAGDQRVLEEPLSPPGAPFNIFARAEDLLFKLMDSFTEPFNAPADLDHPGLRAKDLIEVESAIAGAEQVLIRARADGKYIVNVAVPVQRFRRVLGALLLTAQTGDIDAIVRKEQRRIGQIFLGALAVTLLMAYFFARTLVRPIRILAGAAERVRRGIGREEHLPEFAHQKDEIGDLSRSLSAMTRALYNQIDAVERFAADVAHELKNPITSLRSAIETLERSEDPAVQAKLMAILKEDVKRLDRLVSDVSDASRLDAELVRTRLEPVELGPLFEQIINGYEAIGLGRGIKIKYRPENADKLMVQGIEARLSQVWRNLIDNAISFSPEFGLITVYARRGTRQIHVRVDDEGPGISEGAEHKIFKRFYSERPEGEAFGNHSGLGLNICRQIIEAHGGRIDVSNRLDDAGHIIGASFHVVLPRSDD